MATRRPKPGTVIQVPIPDGRYAYGRVYRDATVCFYTRKSDGPGAPPVGERDFVFCVGVYDDALRNWQPVGFDPFDDSDDDGWPPPCSVRDPITGMVRLYHRGEIYEATDDQVAELEPAAVWDEDQIVRRLMTGD